MMTDPRACAMGEIAPFDGKRMIVGGFASIVEEGLGGTMGYADGFLAPVHDANTDAYRAMADNASVVLLDHCATRVLVRWGCDVSDVTATDYKLAAFSEPEL